MPMCMAATLWLGGDQGLDDLLDGVIEDRDMSLARVQPQSASRYPLGELLRMLRGHVRVLFSVVEPHVCHDFVVPERPRSPQAHYVVYPAHRALTHGFLEHLRSDRPNLRPLENPAIYLRNLGHESRVPLVGVLA